jgi:hypothetical protein
VSGHKLIMLLLMVGLLWNLDVNPVSRIRGRRWSYLGPYLGSICCQLSCNSFPLVCTGAVQTSRTNPLMATPCAKEVRGFSPYLTEPLVVPPCAGEGHNPSTPRTNSLATNTGEADIAGKSVNAPILDVSIQCGVRTRNQKQRGRSGRVSPSPAKL